MCAFVTVHSGVTSPVKGETEVTVLSLLTVSV